MIFADEPIAVRAWQRIDERFGVDVANAGVLVFSKGRMAVVSCSFETNGNGFYQVIGRKGIIEVPRGFILGIRTLAPEALIVIVDADGLRREELMEPLDHYQLVVEAFADAILSGRPVPISPQDSISNARALDAFAKSARKGREVKIPSFLEGQSS